MTFIYYNAVYIDITGVKSQTSIRQISNLEDSQITNLIIKAQLMIDSYIGDIENKVDEAQNFKFPSSDYDPTVPINITMATLYLVENLYQFYKKEYGEEVSQEAWDGYSVGFKDGNELNNIEIFNGNIRNLLLEYGINKDNLNKKAFKINY